MILTYLQDATFRPGKRCSRELPGQPKPVSTIGVPQAVPAADSTEVLNVLSPAPSEKCEPGTLLASTMHFWKRERQRANT